MILRQDECNGCGLCVTYCPVRAISVQNKKAFIDRDQCVECGVCDRLGVCARSCFEKEESLPWPRSVRAILSDPLTCFKETGVTGRGTEEMKTNDLTNRYLSGEVGLALDVGRPNVTTRLRDVERITVAVAEAGVHFEEKNPITHMMKDRATGRLDPEMLDERVMSAVVEFTVRIEQAPEILRILDAVQSKVDTVFCVGIICRVEEDDSIPVIPVLEQAGFIPSGGAKVNLGLGRRLVDQRSAGSSPSDLAVPVA
ncbi:MAG: 4Fe-4S binding protein [Chloroflexota bacterium]